MNGFEKEKRAESTDLSTVESQRNDLVAEEFPEGPYGSDLRSDSSARARLGAGISGLRIGSIMRIASCIWASSGSIPAKTRAFKQIRDKRNLSRSLKPTVVLWTRRLVLS